MAFRKVSVVQVCEVLRRWLHGNGERPAARAAGIDRNGDESQLSDEVIGQKCEAVRPHRPGGHGGSWRKLLAVESDIIGVGSRSTRTTAVAVVMVVAVYTDTDASAAQRGPRPWPW